MEYTIRVERFDCPDQIAEDDTLRLQFWGTVGADGCHAFSRFDVQRDSNRVEVRVLGVVQPELGCPEVIVPLFGEELEIHPLAQGELVITVPRPGESALVDTVRILPADGKGRAD